jgi:acyl-[acyl carrier protein]--UDP-N-acetylglucosamine O-acyltransferase
LKYRGEKTKVIVSDGTTIRECVTLNRCPAAVGQTVMIGAGSMINMDIYVMAQGYRAVLAV